MSSKAIPKLSGEQYGDRMEWLMGAAGYELANVYVAGVGRAKVRAICEQLDEMSRAAEQCARYLRELLPLVVDEVYPDPPASLAGISEADWRAWYLNREIEQGGR
jgi:hypothetical protein